MSYPLRALLLYLTAALLGPLILRHDLLPIGLLSAAALAGAQAYEDAYTSVQPLGTPPTGPRDRLISALLAGVLAPSIFALGVSTPATLGSDDLLSVPLETLKLLLFGLLAGSGCFLLQRRNPYREG